MKVKEESEKVVLKLNIQKDKGSSCKTPDLDAVGKVGWGEKPSFQRHHLKVELIGFAFGSHGCDIIWVVMLYYMASGFFRSIKFTKELIQDREFPPIICGPNVINSIQLLSHV